MIIPKAHQKITDAKGLMTDLMRRFVYAVGQLDPIIGTGSPEGVVEAGQKRLYIDTNGVAGSTLYVKRVSDVGGNKSLGWIQV